MEAQVLNVGRCLLDGVVDVLGVHVLRLHLIMVTPGKHQVQHQIQCLNEILNSYSKIKAMYSSDENKL